MGLRIGVNIEMMAESVIESVVDENEEEIGYLIDTWRARCREWSQHIIIPRPDYSISQRHPSISRLDPISNPSL